VIEREQILLKGLAAANLRADQAEARVRVLEGPACDFARQLARSLYRDIDEVPSIETVAEWEAAVADRIRVAVSERLRELPERMWRASFLAGLRRFGDDDWTRNVCAGMRWARRWLRREVGR
jgi:hypothetical protein